MIVKGNHDRVDDNVSAVDWTILDKRVTVENRFDFEIEGQRILLVHETLSGSKAGSHNLEMDGIKYKEYPHDLIIAGHIHKPQILSKKPFVLVPGSIERVTFGERKEDKYYYVADVTRETVDVRRVSLDVRPMLLIVYDILQKTIDLNDCRIAYDSLPSLLSEISRKPIVHLILRGRREDIRQINYDKLIKLYNGAYSLDIKVEYQNEVVSPSGSNKNELEKIDVSSALEEYCKLNKLDDQTFKLAAKVIKESK